MQSFDMTLFAILTHRLHPIPPSNSPVFPHLNHGFGRNVIAIIKDLLPHCKYPIDQNVKKLLFVGMLLIDANQQGYSSEADCRQ